VCEPFEIPAWYRRVYALDVGWNRTACLWGALDPESDTLFLYSEYYRGQAEPAVHAQAILSRGQWIPGVVDPAARRRAQKDGEQLPTLYRRLGLENLQPADNGVEAGIYSVWSRLSSGRLKVFKNLQNWLSEFRIYRRDEGGKVIKSSNHLMDATRYLVMSGISRAAAKPSRLWTDEDLPRGFRRGNYTSSYDPLSFGGEEEPYAQRMQRHLRR
jgi:Terminase RNaseH-like domain